MGNAPDLLFLQDTDGDDRADVQKVIVTGFGRTDTHELPNAFTWSPEGHLVGLNGVFNFCKITQDNRTYDFTCAMWRIHPTTGRFDLFCEGTSNPWGIAHDNIGNAFVSACVIDHLWHLTETGYYHRQAGPYPPYTWKIESIVDHAHQLAAYCGLHYYDSAVYPEAYRNRLYMGNIHGGCINVDRLDRNGSTYQSHGDPDFLTANDVWFMPVAVQTGPDGCMYVLDWYDRYHCYQDANHDPQGVDRGHGRLYRIRYRDAPRAPKFDLKSESSEALVERLKGDNGFFREQARLVLAERKDPVVQSKLEALVLDTTLPLQSRLHSLWTRLSTHEPVSDRFLLSLLADRESTVRMWGVRAAGNQGRATAEVQTAIQKLAEDPVSDVQLQVVIAASKIEGFAKVPTLLRVAARCGNDSLIPKIIWQNLYPSLPQQQAEFLAFVRDQDSFKAPAIQAIVPRAIQRLLDDPAGVAPAAKLAKLTLEHANASTANEVLSLIEQRTLAGEIKDSRREVLMTELRGLLQSLRNATDPNQSLVASRLLAAWGDRDAATALWNALPNTKELNARGRLLEILARSTPDIMVQRASGLLQQATKGDEAIAVLQAFGAIEDPELAKPVLDAYAKLPVAARSKAIDLLTQRASWSQQLLANVAAERISKSDVGAAALLRLAAQPDAEVRKQVNAIYGSIRTERNPARQQVIDKVRTLVSQRAGNAIQGKQVFTKACAQCHTMHGEGQQVGPDITRNGRGHFDQLLSNVLDPNLVIGQGYQARTVLTSDGRVLTGLLVEDNEQRVVLNTQGGKKESIPRDRIEEYKVSNLSLMPEGVESQLKDQEIVDLFAFLTIETPPGQSPTTLIPGTPAKLHP